MADPYKQGIAAYQSGSFDTAIALFSQAIETNPKHAEAFHARAMVNRRIGRVKDGLDDARSVVRLRPESHKGYLEAGRLCLKAGRMEKAEQMLKQAKERVGAGEVALLETIDKELQQVKDARTAATFCPLHNLPTELFLLIISFAISSHDARPLSPTLPQSFRLNPLITASHVCRAWRQSIEAAPHLWSTLRLDGDKDRSRARQKAKWFAARAGVRTSEKDRKGPGIRSIVLTKAQQLGEHLLTDMLKELQLLGAFPDLRNLTISWCEGVAATSVHQHQIQSVFDFLARHASKSLRSLTVHTDAHLRLHFSLPRFGNLFCNLHTLEMRSTPGSVQAANIALPSRFLPPYDGEEDWPPLTSIKRLVLVNPIWRLQFQDGTVASPTLAETDVPQVEELVLGSTTPPMTWDLFGGKKLKVLEVVNHGDARTLPDPDLSALAGIVESLRLQNSAALTTRLLRIVETASLSFPSLTTLDLRGASITNTHLGLFSSRNAPLLTSLNLSSTASAMPVTTLVLPPYDSLVSLDLSRTSWVSDAFLDVLETAAPKLVKLSMDDTKVPISALIRLFRTTIPPLLQRFYTTQPLKNTGKEAVQQASQNDSKIPPLVSVLFGDTKTFLGLLTIGAGFLYHNINQKIDSARADLVTNDTLANALKGATETTDSNIKLAVAGLAKEADVANLREEVHVLRTKFEDYSGIGRLGGGANGVAKAPQPLAPKAIETTPKHAEAFHARAMVNRRIGRVKDGLDDARSVVRLRPESHKGYLEAGRLCFKAGRMDKAEQMLEQAKERVGAGEVALLETIDKELKQVKDARTAATFCPLHNLPTELFLLIISFAVSSHDARPLSPTLPQSFRLNPLITASHVCRAWRQSIEAAPHLWSTLRLDGDKDRSRARQKAKWFAARAGVRTSEKDRKGPGIRSIVLTKAQQLGEHLLTDMLKELQLLGAFPDLRNLTISWCEGVAATSVHQHQIQSIFDFLARHASKSLRSRTVHTDAHLRLHFSLPRFGNLFCNLHTLEMRSTPGSVQAANIALPSRFLPPYDGEEDWPPLTSIKRLVLVNPIWRLQFQDGTVASPTLAETDVPQVEELVLGPTTPPMTWDLFGGKKLKVLEVVNHGDARTLPDPDLSALAGIVESLRLQNSAALTSRLLRIVETASFSFPSLTTLDLRGASITNTHLGLFSSRNAPLLTSLNLSSTASAMPLTTLVLPPYDSLVSLDLSRTSWVSDAFLDVLETAAPKLVKLSMDDTKVPVSALIRFVESREVGMRELSLMRCTGVTNETAAWLRERVGKGVFRFKHVVVEETKEWRKK
ncbi:hypothetical protein MNV49_003194 [Pseudohyphozyma bogoriensis]|nr:hypothetical protein MNV49_003194 [Pseudohyphozyma bogoriensis]